jgi:hypothetical protein
MTQSPVDCREQLAFRWFPTARPCFARFISEISRGDPIGSKTAAFSEPTPVHLGEVGDESQYMPQAMMIAFANRTVKAGGAAETPSPEYLRIRPPYFVIPAEAGVHLDTGTMDEETTLHAISSHALA